MTWSLRFAFDNVVVGIAKSPGNLIFLIFSPVASTPNRHAGQVMSNLSNLLFAGYPPQSPIPTHARRYASAVASDPTHQHAAGGARSRTLTGIAGYTADNWPKHATALTSIDHRPKRDLRYLILILRMFCCRLSDTLPRRGLRMHGKIFPHLPDAASGEHPLNAIRCHASPLPSTFFWGLFPGRLQHRFAYKSRRIGRRGKDHSPLLLNQSAIPLIRPTRVHSVARSCQAMAPAGRRHGIK